MIRIPEPTPSEKQALRVKVQELAGGQCELRLHKRCLYPQILPLSGDLLWRGHLVHIRARSIGGEWTTENCLWGCAFCHNGSLHTTGTPIDVEAIMQRRKGQ